MELLVLYIHTIYIKIYYYKLKNKNKHVIKREKKPKVLFLLKTNKKHFNFYLQEE